MARFLICATVCFESLLVTECTKRPGAAIGQKQPWTRMDSTR